jgi:hypothetical protein
LHQRASLSAGRGTAGDGNWDDENTEEEFGFRQGEEERIDGVVDMEDDVFLEFDEDEMEVK